MRLGQLIDLPKIIDPRGNLTVVEGYGSIPFDIRRAYWVYDVPGGESRGGHAHRRLRQLLVAISGSFTVTLDPPLLSFESPLSRSSDRNRYLAHLRRLLIGCRLPCSRFRTICRRRLHPRLFGLSEICRQCLK